MIYFSEMTLTHFGKFENWSQKLTDGLTVLYGENEAGKSTIQLFFKVMLYGVSGSKKDERGVKERERMIPWDQKYAEGTLKLIADGREITVWRRFGKTAAGDKTLIMDAATGEKLMEYDEKNFGEQILHVPEQIFEKTFWLRQGGADIGGADGEISKRLLNLIQTGEEDVSADRVLADLEKEKRLRKAKDKRSNPGTIDRLWQKKEELLRERYHLISAMRQRGAEQERLLQLQKEQEDAKAELEKLQDLQQKKQRFLELDARLKKWQQAEKMQNLAQQAESRAAYQTFQNLKEEDVQHAESLKKTYETLDRSDRIEYDKEQAKQQKELQRKALQKSGRLMLAGAMLILLALVFAVLRQRAWVALTAVCGAAGIFASAVGFYQMQSGKKKEKEQEDLLQQITAKEEEKKREKENLRTALEQLLAPYGCKTAEELRNGFQECRQAKMEAESYKSTYASLMEGEDAEKLRTEMEEAEAYFAQGRELAALCLDEDIDRLQKTVLHCATEIKAVEGKLSYVYTAQRTPADAETELLQVQAQIEEEEKRYRAAELAMTVFTEVYQKRKSDFTPLVNEKVNENLSALTKGKYQDVKVSEEYRMRLSDRDGRLCTAESLSRGTYEQIYFALRLALCDLMGDGTQPLFLDDFLMSYDDEREKSAFDLLIMHAKHRQILFFSCHARDQRRAAETNSKWIHLKEET